MSSEVLYAADCVFCRELGGSRETNFSKRYPEIASRIVGETTSLVAFPCIGQIGPGHFLVAPKTHISTLRNAWNRIPELHEELNALLTHVHSLFEVDPKDSLYFEHGALCPQDGGCGIYHAHMHVIPSVGNVDLTHNFSKQRLPHHLSIESALSSVNVDGCYLFFGSFVHGFFSQNLTSPLPSQTLRKLVARELSNRVWDWREAGREDGVLDMLNRTVKA